jgi:hypothetical protein
MITEEEVEAKDIEFGLHAANIERDYRWVAIPYLDRLFVA